MGGTTSLYYAPTNYYKKKVFLLKSKIQGFYSCL